jgi:hypothetical protein
VILPTKHIPTRQSLLGVSALLIDHLNIPRTVTSLWEKVRGVPEIGSFQRFILALDLLYVLGAVHIENGLLYRSRS